MLNELSKQFPELIKQAQEVYESLKVTKDETELFNDWYGKLVWDKTHFQSCFRRNLIRDEIRTLMLIKYVVSGRRLGVFK